MRSGGGVFLTPGCSPHFLQQLFHALPNQGSSGPSGDCAGRASSPCGDSVRPRGDCAGRARSPCGDSVRPRGDRAGRAGRAARGMGCSQASCLCPLVWPFACNLRFEDSARSQKISAKSKSFCRELQGPKTKAFRNHL